MACSSPARPRRWRSSFHSDGSLRSPLFTRCKVIVSPSEGEPFRCEWCAFVASRTGGCGGWWRLVEVGGGWWRLVEVGGGWWRLVEVGGGWVGNLHQPPPSFTTFTNLPAQCPNTFVRPTIPPVMLTTTHRKRRLSPIPAPSFGTT